MSKAILSVAGPPYQPAKITRRFSRTGIMLLRFSFFLSFIYLFIFHKSRSGCVSCVQACMVMHDNCCDYKMQPSDRLTSTVSFGSYNGGFSPTGTFA